jgi:CHAT domain-containing protein/tetratricopeptide (TPR) repeat protein
MRLRLSAILLAVATLFVCACATSGDHAPSKRYGLDDLDAFAAVAEGEGRDALAYYGVEASTLERGSGQWAKVNAARAHGAAMIVAQYLGLYQQALRHGTKAVDLLSTLPDYDQVHRGRFMLCLVLGFTHLQTGDLIAAQRQFERCGEVAAQTRWALSASPATVVLGLSSVAYFQGNYAHAAQEGRRSAALYEDFLTKWDSTRLWNRRYSEDRERVLSGLALALLVAGRSEWELKHFASADEILRRARDRAQDAGAHQFRVAAQAALAEVAFDRGDMARAMREAHEALEESRRLGFSFLTTLILTRLGVRHGDTNRHETALVYFQQAMQLVESTRSRMEESALRGFFLEDKQLIYHGAVRSALALGKAVEAFGFAERGRARAFLDLLGTQTLLARRTATTLVAAEERMRDRLENARAASRVAQAPEAASSLRGQGTRTRDVAVGEYDAFIDRVRNENPEQASLMTVEPVRLAEIQDLLHEGTTLLEYFVTEKETIVWVVERHRMEVVRLNVPRSTLVSEIRQLRLALVDLHPVDVVQRHAQVLHERLLSPVRHHVRSGSLLIVPHDVLHYVPFPALRSAAGRWLVEDHTLTTIPSASVLAHLGPKGPGAARRGLIVGNPDVGPGLGLPWAEREAVSIAKLYPDATLLLGRAASETSVKALSTSVGMLHFATHGELSEKDPLSSALLLAADSQGDGRLEVREIFRLDLNARLVILSACETALGKLSRGDELVGLQRAFLYAGAGAVVATLWKVEDYATFDLMEEFHVQLRTHRPAESLRNAQRATIHKLPHPFFWAAFGLTGVPW